jgi:hypothetical protein
MEIKAIVPFDGGVAHYLISPEGSGVYQARLLEFQGEAPGMPPSELVLVKGYRQWRGSYDRQDLLNGIGDAIDGRQRHGNPT